MGRSALFSQDAAAKEEALASGGQMGYNGQNVQGG